MKVLRDNYTRPINPRDGQTVVGREYGELLYHLNRLMQRGSLMENYAIKKLQEQIITQVSFQRAQPLKYIMFKNALFFSRRWRPRWCSMRPSSSWRTKWRPWTRRRGWRIHREEPNRRSFGLHLLKSLTGCSKRIL